MTEISVIVPTLDEEAVIEHTLRGILERCDEAGIEVIVTDGGSRDRTVTIAQRYARVVNADRGRARQLNAAARQAAGEILFFVHADMDLPPGAIAAVRRMVLVEGYDGGGFSNVFSRHNARIKRLGRVLNLRLRDNDHPRNTVFFGDNGIFVRRSVFETLGGFPSPSWKTTISPHVCGPATERYGFSRHGSSSPRGATNAPGSCGRGCSGSSSKASTCWAVRRASWLACTATCAEEETHLWSCNVRASGGTDSGRVAGRPPAPGVTRPCGVADLRPRASSGKQVRHSRGHALEGGHE